MIRYAKIRNISSVQAEDLLRKKIDGTELNIALYFGLLTAGEVLDVLNDRGEQVEAVVTGRYAPQELINAADLVTEMTEIKHYYQKGVESRDGIDR